MRPEPHCELIHRCSRERARCPFCTRTRAHLRPPDRSQFGPGWRARLRSFGKLCGAVACGRRRAMIDCGRSLVAITQPSGRARRDHGYWPLRRRGPDRLLVIRRRSTDVSWDRPSVAPQSIVSAANSRFRDRICTDACAPLQPAGSTNSTRTPPASFGCTKLIRESEVPRRGVSYSSRTPRERSAEQASSIEATV